MNEDEPREIHPMAQAIRAHRLRAQLSRDDISERSNGAISASMVSYYERSTHPMAPAIVKMFANALEMPMAEIEKFANVPPVGPQKKRTKPYLAMNYRQRDSEAAFAALMTAHPYSRNLTRTPDDERYTAPDVQLAWEFWEHARARYEYASLLQSKKGQ